MLNLLCTYNVPFRQLGKGNKNSSLNSHLALHCIIVNIVYQHIISYMLQVVQTEWLTYASDIRLGHSMALSGTSHYYNLNMILRVIGLTSSRKRLVHRNLHLSYMSRPIQDPIGTLDILIPRKPYWICLWKIRQKTCHKIFYTKNTFLRGTTLFFPPSYKRLHKLQHFTTKNIRLQTL